MIVDASPDEVVLWAGLENMMTRHDERWRFCIEKHRPMPRLRHDRNPVGTINMLKGLNLDDGGGPGTWDRMCRWR